MTADDTVKRHHRYSSVKLKTDNKSALDLIKSLTDARHRRKSFAMHSKWDGADFKTENRVRNRSETELSATNALQGMTGVSLLQAPE